MSCVDSKTVRLTRWDRCLNKMFASQAPRAASQRNRERHASSNEHGPIAEMKSRAAMPEACQTSVENPMSRILVCLCAMLVFTASARAQPYSRLDEIFHRGTLRVGMTDDYRPFTYFDKAAKKFTGFDVDMATALGKALGVRVDFVQTAWPQLMKDFAADKFDVAMSGISITLDR